MCEATSRVGLAVAERYVSSFCWLSLWEGAWVRRSVALDGNEYSTPHQVSGMLTS
jgi:hypothetical protein